VKPKSGLLERISHHPRGSWLVAGVFGLAGMLRLFEGRNSVIEGLPIALAIFTLVRFRTLENPKAAEVPKNIRLSREEYVAKLRQELGIFFIAACMVLGIQLLSSTLSLTPRDESRSPLAQ
jgi:hypothetical protein